MLECGTCVCAAGAGKRLLLEHKSGKEFDDPGRQRQKEMYCISDAEKAEILLKTSKSM